MKQVLLSKVSNISIELSDTFSEYQVNSTFDALKNIAKAQEEQYNKN